MSSSTSSSKVFRVGPTAFLVFLAVNAVACAAVLLVPWTGAGWFQDLCVKKAAGDSRDIVMLGDSKVFPFVEGTVDCPFFDPPAYAFAMDSATVLYQRILYDRLVNEAGLRPKVVFYSTGANNFAENGLHVQRDYAMRFLARSQDMIGYSHLAGCFPYLADCFFSRLYPIYGRRIEITHLMFRGYKERVIDLSPPVRNPIDDENYLLIYKRSVLADFKVSRFHLENLKQFVREVEESGAALVVLDLPVTEEMRALEEQECATWDEAMREVVAETGVRYVDLRENPDLPFRDINHLSNLGAKEVTERWLEPLVEELAGR